MEGEIKNRQIPIQSIIEVADYFEEYKNRYLKIFDEEDRRNKGKNLSETDYEHYYGEAKVTYTISLKDGKEMRESDYNWFVSYMKKPQILQEAEIQLYVSYYSKGERERYLSYEKHNSITETVDFYSREFSGTRAVINLSSTNQEKEANNLYYTTEVILNNNKERFDKTIKHRKIRTQAFCIAVGVVLSYILYAVLSLNANKLPIDISTYLTNKYIVVFGQWFAAILLGNVFSYWFVLSLYKPLIPDARYAGYNYSAGKSVYVDDIEEYQKHSEVHMGNLWDAGKRREKIEKIYSITRIILLIQLLISAVLYFVMK